MYKYEYLFKIVIVGNRGVGKSSLVYRYSNNMFPQSHMVTIGVDFVKKIERVDDKDVYMQLWDYTSSERFCSIPKAFYRNASAVLIAYDITSKSSFSNLEGWVNNIESLVEPNATIFLVGTKCDLIDKREVNYEEGEKFAEEYNLKFYETSALDDININEMFTELAINLKSKADNFTLLHNPYSKPNILLQNHNVPHQNNKCSGLKKCTI